MISPSIWFLSHTKKTCPVFELQPYLFLAVTLSKLNKVFKLQVLLSNKWDNIADSQDSKMASSIPVKQKLLMANWKSCRVRYWCGISPLKVLLEHFKGVNTSQYYKQVCQCEERGGITGTSTVLAAYVDFNYCHYYKDRFCHLLVMSKTLDPLPNLSWPQLTHIH